MILNADEQVFALYIDGTPVEDGVYDKDSGLVDIDGVNLISGNGKLTVKGAPSGTLIIVK